MVCVAVYAALVASVAVAGNLYSALWSVAAQLLARQYILRLPPMLHVKCWF